MSCSLCARTHLPAPGSHSHAAVTAAAESWKKRRRWEEMRETKMGITIIVSEDTGICISSVGGEGYTAIYIWRDKRQSKRGRHGLIRINAFNII